MTQVSVAYASQVLTFAVGIVFALSSFPKMRRPGRFLGNVGAYKILPEWVAVPFAFVVIVAEAAIAISTMTGVGRTVGLAAAVGLLLTFAVGVGFNLYRDRKVRCGCFGESDEMITRWSLARVLSLLALAIMALVGGLLAGTAPTNVSVAGPFLSAALLLVTGSWLFRWPDLRVLTMEAPRRAATGLEMLG
jgi:Methylamine utilisation protein MauE